MNQQIRDQYRQDLTYLAGGKPVRKGSLTRFIGDYVGFLCNYYLNSWKSPKKAREEVVKMQEGVRTWLDSTPNLLEQDFREEKEARTMDQTNVTVF